MIHKLLLIPILVGYLLINQLIIYTNDYQESKNSSLFYNPLIFKAFTGSYSTLIADKLWLLTSQVDELKFAKKNNTEKDVIVDEMVSAYSTINHLDPNFTAPIVYASSYLITQKKEFKKGIFLINEALKKNPENIKLIYLKFVYLTTYKEIKPDIKEVVYLAKKLYEKEVIFMGHLKVSDFIAETVEHLSKDKIDKKENLLRLYKYAKNKEIKEDIELLLKNYEKGNNNE